ncbi:MAG: hypothetical protein ACKVU4_04180 [Phycisphaerales bacterium]
MAARMRRTSFALVAGALAASTARADVKDYDWTLYDNGFGGGALTPFTMTINGGNAGFGGSTEYRAQVCVAGRVALAGTYQSVDTGAYDHVYYSVNGVKTIIATNANQGPFTAEFAVRAGDTFALGVTTTDGQGGPGKATIGPVVPIAELDFSSFLTWTHSQSPAGVGGAALLPPQVMKVVGGNSGVAGFSHVHTQTQMDMVVTAKGAYSSVDEEDFDQGYVYTQAPGSPPLYASFIDNATQGAFTRAFNVTGRQKFGLGVFTADGAFGPGVLTVHSLKARATAGHIPNFGWVLDDTAQGGGGVFGEEMVVVGGDAGEPGYTEFTVESLFDFCVKAELDYYSEDEGEYDAAYFIVNGTTGLVATNATQGVKQVEFSLQKGDVFGFGVATADGQAGPGELIVTRFRAFPEQPCYPDCTGDGVRTVADFGCFQTRFTLGVAYGDCNADGQFTVSDFGCFQSKFVIGCP